MQNFTEMPGFDIVAFSEIHDIIIGLTSKDKDTYQNLTKAM